MRCGTGLFVSGDLLRPGPIELSVVSLRHSMAGLAMAQGQPIVVTAPATGGAGAARQVLCLPVALQPTSSSGSNTGQPSGSSSDRGQQSSNSSSDRGQQSGGSSDTGQQASAGSISAAAPPLYVGAFMVGAAAEDGAQPAPPRLWAGLQALAGVTAPYLLILGLTLAEQMGELLRLRGAEAAACGSDGEEDALQDVPLEGCGPPPPPPPRGGAGGAAGPLPARDSPGGSEPPAEAANVAAAAALPRRSHLAGGAASAPGGSGRSLQPGGAAPPAVKQRQGAEGGRGAEQAQGLEAPSKPRHAHATHAPPPRAAPRGSLLGFADSAMEARFAAAYNRSLACSDALFAAMHLAAALCVAALHPAALAGSAAVPAFAAALLVPLLAPLLAQARWARA